MLRRTMFLATLAVGIAIGSCDSPTGDGGVLGTERISGVPPAAGSARMSIQDAAAVGTTGCVAQGSGLLRIVASADECKTSETAIVLGGGLVGYEIVTTDWMIPVGTPSGGSGALIMNCPAGKRVLGGGASALVDLNGVVQPSLSGSATFDGSYPQDEDTWVAGWGYVSSGSGSLKGMRGFAVCAY